MKKIFHNTLSVLMAFVVLLSTMSFTIYRHYCGDILVDTTIFELAKSCGMDNQESTPILDYSMKKSDCCSDKHIAFEGQNELKLSIDLISLDQQLFAASFVYSYIYLFEVIEEKNTSFDDYPPPIIVRQIYKLDEVYLI
jgi:hypothetical protein